jgi:hypothetical protein
MTCVDDSEETKTLACTSEFGDLSQFIVTSVSYVSKILCAAAKSVHALTTAYRPSLHVNEKTGAI